jgi:26S proteasome regulatory subunit N2
VAFVRQGALIALAMIMMQQTADHPKYKYTKEAFKTTMMDKHEDVLAKVGAIYGQGIMNAGGQNVTTRLVNANGHIRMQSVVGTLVFTQFWFWFPLGNFLSIAMSPTAVICLNKNLKMPKIELKSNAPPSKYAYAPATEPPKEKSKDKIETAVLSITSKAKAAKAKDDKEKATEVDSMEVDAKPADAAKDESAKTDVGGDTEMTDDAKSAETTPVESATFTMLSNPARVLLPQMAVVELEGDSRCVQPVVHHCSLCVALPLSSRSGHLRCAHQVVSSVVHRYRPATGRGFGLVTVLEDNTPDEPEEFIEMKQAAAGSAGDAEVEEASCPEPFQFDEAAEGE